MSWAGGGGWGRIEHADTSIRPWDDSYSLSARSRHRHTPARTRTLTRTRTRTCTLTRAHSPGYPLHTQTGLSGDPKLFAARAKIKQMATITRRAKLQAQQLKLASG